MSTTGVLIYRVTFYDEGGNVTHFAEGASLYEGGAIKVKREINPTIVQKHIKKGDYRYEVEIRSIEDTKR
jgi:hypothetical protein